MCILSASLFYSFKTWINLVCYLLKQLKALLVIVVFLPNVIWELFLRWFSPFNMAQVCLHSNKQSENLDIEIKNLGNKCYPSNTQIRNMNKRQFPFCKQSWIIFHIAFPLGRCLNKTMPKLIMGCTLTRRFEQCSDMQWLLLHVSMFRLISQCLLELYSAASTISDLFLVSCETVSRIAKIRFW